MGLDQQRREGADLVRPGTVGHAAERILLAPAGAELQHHRAELLGEERMRPGHLHADPAECRFKAEARFDANQHQVERVGKAVDDFPLAARRARAHPKARKIEAGECRDHADEIKLHDRRAVAAQPHQSEHGDWKRDHQAEAEKRIGTRRIFLLVARGHEPAPEGRVLGIHQRNSRLLDRSDQRHPRAARIMDAQALDRAFGIPAAYRRRPADQAPAELLALFQHHDQAIGDSDHCHEQQQQQRYPCGVIGEEIVHQPILSGRSCAGSNRIRWHKG